MPGHLGRAARRLHTLHRGERAARYRQPPSGARPRRLRRVPWGARRSARSACAAIRSSRAPGVVRGSRSFNRCPTTASGRPWTAFSMCARCRREYEDPDDRRFHAENIACADCGPRIGLRGPDGAAVAEPDAIGRAADALRAGGVVAIKGVGGYHLACDAREWWSGRGATQAKAAGGEAPGGHGGRCPRSSGAVPRLGRRGASSWPRRPARSSFSPGARAPASPRRSRRAAASSGSSCRTRRCTICSWRPPGPRS